MMKILKKVCLFFVSTFQVFNFIKMSTKQINQKNVQSQMKAWKQKCFFLLNSNDCNDEETVKQDYLSRRLLFFVVPDIEIAPKAADESKENVQDEPTSTEMETENITVKGTTVIILNTENFF